MPVALPIVAVVGRPNVGKSTLFNKLIGKRLSIVENTPGVTRDRIYAKCEWRDRAFMIVDTGGIEPTTEDVILKQMREQAQLAIEQADVIILVTDVRCGVTADDSAVANMLQKSGKPIILAVNKCDKIGEPPMELYEFYNLGLGDPFPVSAEHGHGSGDMLDAVYDALPPESELEEQDDAIRVAIIGKPNVGKSSLVNRIAGEQRVIVSNVAGTTRDATDTTVENEEGKFVLIDTAGIRRKSKVTEKIEQYSVLRAYMAVDRADVCLIVIDATEGFTEQDSKVAGYAHEQGKASIVVVNKWDLVEKDGKTMQNFEEWQDHFACSTSRKKGKDMCETHFILAGILEKGVWKLLQILLWHISDCEDLFRDKDVCLRSRQEQRTSNAGCEYQPCLYRFSAQEHSFRDGQPRSKKQNSVTFATLFSLKM